MKTNFTWKNHFRPFFGHFLLDSDSREGQKGDWVGLEPGPL